MSESSGLPTLELGTAATVVTLAIVNVLAAYRDTAPKLKDLRHAPPGDYETRQLLLDADIFGGVAVVLIGGGAAFLSRKWTPLVLSASGLLFVSLYYRMVYNSASPSQPAGDNTRETP